jgi:hypothetical protein
VAYASALSLASATVLQCGRVNGTVEEESTLKLGPYKLMLLGIVLMAAAFLPMGQFVWVPIAAGWGLIIAGVIRRWK